jgi:hypothetical protein
MKLFWIVHNNTCNTGRVIVEGLKKISPQTVNYSSREDLIWLKTPSDYLYSRWKDKPLGKFPDYDSFVPELASPDFWNLMSNLSSEDFIIFTVNAGPNHNAHQAEKIIKEKNLYDQTIILDEDESAKKGIIEFNELYMKSKLILTGLGGDRVYPLFSCKRLNVFFFGFNGIEDRYIPPEYREKSIDVFFKSRVEGWMTHRIPFRDCLMELDKKGLLGKACIMPEFNESSTNNYFKLVSGDRYHPDYYDYLNRSRIVVYLNGYNPIGYQFWENCANKCLTIHQTPWKSSYYHGGSYNAPKFHWEHYNPPFVPNEDFFYFETPEDLKNILLDLMKKPELVNKASDSCYRKAMNFTSERQAIKFLNIIENYGH